MFRASAFICGLVGGLLLAGGGYGQEVRQQSLASYQFLTADSRFFDYWASFSPDGETIVFSRRPIGSPVAELFVVPLAGGPPKRLSSSPLPVSQTRPDWSKRHGWIAFTGLREGKASLWFIRGDGSDAHEIQVEGLLAPFYPSWYPDYPAVAVVDFGERDGGVLKRIDAQGQAAIDLTDRREILAGMPRVSPDGKLIAFAGQRNQGKKYNQEHNRIWVLDQEGNLHELDPEQGRTPSWSPDGKRVAFESKRGSPTGSYAIFVIAASGGPARQLTPYELNANHPTWSPDGKKLAFAAPVPAAKDAWGIAVLSIPD